MIERFTLREGVTTRQVNAAIRKAQAEKITKWDDFLINREVKTTNERRRLHRRGPKPITRYVFGIGIFDKRDEVFLADTLIATYESGSSQIDLVFLNNYRGWHNTGPYDRLRIAIRDQILYESNIIDRSIPAETV